MKIFHLFARKKSRFGALIMINVVVSMILMSFMLYLFGLGRRNQLFKLNWAGEINYEVILLRAAIVIVIQLIILFLSHIFRRHSAVLRNFRIKSAVIIFYLYLLAILNLIMEYFNVSIVINSVINSLTIFGFFALLYFIYIMVKIFDTICECLEKEKILSQQLNKLSYTDKLTGLPNRRYLLSQIQNEQNRSNNCSLKFGVLFLDLDEFKKVNDTFGHDVGDYVLKEVAKRILKSVRDVDTVARIGGDEFVILVSHIDKESILEDVAVRIIKAINEKIYVNEFEITIGTSIGIAIYPQDGLIAEDLIKKADLALYEVKRKNKNNYKFYSD